MILDLIKFMLVRNQERRPSLAAMIDRVNQTLESQQLPCYKPIPAPQSNLPDNQIFDISDQFDHGIDLLEGAQMKEGLVLVNNYLYVSCGQSLTDLSASEAFTHCKVSLSIVLDGGVDCTYRGSFIGMCSRRGIQGLIVDSCDGVASEVLTRVATLAENCRGSKNRLLVCSDVNGSTLVNFLVDLVMHTENYTRFEGILDVARCLQWK